MHAKEKHLTVLGQASGQLQKFRYFYRVTQKKVQLFEKSSKFDYITDLENFFLYIRVKDPTNLRLPSHEQTQTGLSFRSVWNSFRSTVEALGVLTWRRRNETQVDLKFVSVSQVGLSFQVDLKFSCEQKFFSFRGEMNSQTNWRHVCLCSGKILWNAHVQSKWAELKPVWKFSCEGEAN